MYWSIYVEAFHSAVEDVSTQAPTYSTQQCKTVHNYTHNCKKHRTGTGVSRHNVIGNYTTTKIHGNIAEHHFSSSAVDFFDVRIWKVANLQIIHICGYSAHQTVVKFNYNLAVLIMSRPRIIYKIWTVMHNFDEVKNSTAKSSAGNCILGKVWTWTTTICGPVPGEPGWAGNRNLSLAISGIFCSCWLQIRDVQKFFFISVRFLKKKTLLWFRMSSEPVQFSLKNAVRFGYYSYL